MTGADLDRQKELAGIHPRRRPSLGDLILEDAGDDLGGQVAFAIPLLTQIVNSAESIDALAEKLGDKLEPLLHALKKHKHPAAKDLDDLLHGMKVTEGGFTTLRVATHNCKQRALSIIANLTAAKTLPKK